MFSVASCPSCNTQVLLPQGATPTSRVRCPHCHREYSLSEVFAALPPALVLLDAPSAEAAAPHGPDSPLGVGSDPHAANAMGHLPNGAGVAESAAAAVGEFSVGEEGLSADAWGEPATEFAAEGAKHDETIAFNAEHLPFASAGQTEPGLGHDGLSDLGDEAFSFDVAPAEHGEQPAEIPFDMEGFADDESASPVEAPVDGPVDDIVEHDPHGFQAGFDPVGQPHAEDEHAAFEFAADPLAETPGDELGAGDLGGGELGAGEFGAGEFGAGEFGAGEFGANEFGAGEAGEHAFGPGEFGAAGEIGGDEFTPAEGFHEDEFEGHELPAFGHDASTGAAEEGEVGADAFGPIEGFETPAHALGGAMASRLTGGEFHRPASEDDGEEIGFMPEPAPEDEDDGKKKGKKSAKGKGAKSPKAKKPRSLVFTLLFLLFGGATSLSCMYVALIKFIGPPADVLGITQYLPDALLTPEMVAKRNKKPQSPIPPWTPAPQLAQADAPAAEPGEPKAAAEPGQMPAEPAPAEPAPAAEPAQDALAAPAPGGKPAAPEASLEPADPTELMTAPDKPKVATTDDSLDDLLAPKKPSKAKPAPAEDDLLGAKPAEDDGFGAPKKKAPAEVMPADDPLAEKPAPGAEPATPNSLDDLLAPEKPSKPKKPATDELPGFEEKPTPEKPAPAEPEMELPAGGAPKPAKGATDELPGEPDPLADKPAKPAKAVMNDDLLAPEPKAPAKAPADDPLMADEKPAPAKPAEPPAEPPAEEPVAPLNAATYAAADVASALQAAEESDNTMSAPDAIPPDELKKTKAAYFRSLYKLGEVLTNAADDPSEPYLKNDKAAAMALMKKIAADPAKLAEVSNAAGKWLKYSKRGEHSGIMLSGAVGSISQQGKLYELQVTIPGQEEPVSVFSAKKPTVAQGDEVLLMGSVIDDPGSNLPDYAGKQPNVIWNGLTLKL